MNVILYCVKGDHHWCKSSLGTGSNDLNWWWHSILTHLCATKPLSFKKRDRRMAISYHLQQISFIVTILITRQNYISSESDTRITPSYFRCGAQPVVRATLNVSLWWISQIYLRYHAFVWLCVAFNTALSRSSLTTHSWNKTRKKHMQDTIKRCPI